MQILQYDYDISKFLCNGLDDNVLMAREWYGNEKTAIIESRQILQKGGMLWGPYSKLMKGEYTVACNGNNLGNATVDIYSRELGGICYGTCSNWIG